MGLFSERFTPAWVVQFYSGLKTIVYVLSLCALPFELRAGHPFAHLPYADFPETGWRVGLRLMTLAFWVAVFLWAGGKLWPASTRGKEKAESPRPNPD